MKANVDEAAALKMGKNDKIPVLVPDGNASSIVLSAVVGVAE